MNFDERLQSLKGTDLFQSFSPAELRAFAEKVVEVSLLPGEVLFQEGSPGDEMYILIEGALRIFKNARTITTLVAVDYIGEMAILEDKPRSASVEALGECVLLKITADQFREFFAGQPGPLVALMRTLSQRIRNDTELIAAEFEKANILIHDMRNVLCSFLQLDLVADEINDEVTKDSLRHMMEARRNLSLMMEEALANAKRLFRPYLVTEGALDQLLLDLVESELAVHPDVADKRIAISIRKQLPLFSFHQLDVRRVICNLILNAAQASGRGALIEVELTRTGDFAELLVRDHGVGVSEAISEKIFQPHFTTKPGGSGLGLASCKEIIEKRHGGTIFLSAQPGGATVFGFRLPLHFSGCGAAPSESEEYQRVFRFPRPGGGS